MSPKPSLPQQEPEYIPANLLSPPDVAEILKVTTKTLEVWRRTRPHELPFHRIHRAIRYQPSDVINFLEKMRIGGSAN